MKFVISDLIIYHDLIISTSSFKISFKRIKGAEVFFFFPENRFSLIVGVITVKTSYLDWLWIRGLIEKGNGLFMDILHYRCYKWSNPISQAFFQSFVTIHAV